VKSPRVVANLAVFLVAFFVMAGWAVRNVVSVDQLDKPYAIAAEFPNAFGVLPNAEVTYLGVGLGKVTGVDRRPGGVIVRMSIERDRRIPAEATAAISRKSAIGEPYVDFAPPAGSDGGGPFLSAGDVVPRSRTTVPLEFSELLRSASGVIGSVPPESVSTLVHELAVGLEGRADSLRKLAQAGDELSATFAARTDTLDRLAENNTRLTRVVTEHRGSLGQSLTDLREVAASLRAAKGDVAVLLDRGSVLLAQTADLVARNKGNLDCDLKILERVIDITSDDRSQAELRALLDIGPRAYAGVWDSRDVEADGVWIRVGNISNGANPPRQYLPPKERPAVAQVQPCLSPLRATGIDYRPGGSTRVPISALPATGGGAAGGALVIGAIALAIRRRLR
jgi:phospholipid/cholesterol/gamma-HCH transport system substrate-binding protein